VRQDLAVALDLSFLPATLTHRLKLPAVFPRSPPGD
jgi:hypothetical protein